MWRDVQQLHEIAEELVLLCDDLVERVGPFVPGQIDQIGNLDGSFREGRRVERDLVFPPDLRELGKGHPGIPIRPQAASE